MNDMIQIDVKEVKDNIVICSLYAHGRFVQIIMHRNDYDHLCSDGFFIRSGETRDFAGMLNTTKEYFKEY